MWLLAVLCTAALLQTHLITGSFFIFFYAVFFILTFIFVLLNHLCIRNGFAGISSCISVQLIRKVCKKALMAASVSISAVLICMWCLGPVAFYDDLKMKQVFLAREKTAESARQTPPLAVFSLTDTSWNFSSNESQVARFQTGIIIFASFIAFIYFNARRRTLWSLPFILTAGFIILVVVRPSLFNYPPLKYFDIAQFSYRFLNLFTLVASVAGAVALRSFFRSIPGFTYAPRTTISLILITLSLAVAVPYVYPRVLKDQWVNYNVNSSMIRASQKLIYGEDDYLRVPPRDDAGPDVWTDPGRLTVAREGKSGDWRFRVDLAKYYLNSSGPRGEILLDVLFYPSLQQIEIFIDGIPAFANFETYWQQRDSFGPFRIKEVAGFHGLKLTGMPDKGIFEARVRFTGFRWANLTSLSACLIIFCIAGYRSFRLLFPKSTEIHLN
jgi:hypothetical protein